MFQPRLTEMFGATTFIASLDCGGFHHKIAQACQQRFTQGKQQTQPIPADLISVTAASRIINVKPGTIRDWVHRGTIRGYRKVGRILVSRKDVCSLVKPIAI
jgi:excisionase family DNA binding protein